MESKIILATTSPYRIEALKMTGLDFVSEGSDVDEDFNGRPEKPDELVALLAKMKADSVAKKHASGIVIGFDSVGWFKGNILEKPKSREDAGKRLKALSGNVHEFYTGIHMIDVGAGKDISRVVRTTIRLRNLEEGEINRYLDQDPKFSTYAIGFDPWGHFSATFTEKIEGSYNNYLRGIPLETIIQMLKEIGFEF